jgi:two-component system, OmpR family, KDP operon response regulator KdpE
VNRNLTSNVLIVDDSHSIRVALRTVLAANGFVIVEAARGEEALDLVHAMEFDAVLLDINMPGMNGIEVCRLVRQSWPRLPIIMLTVQDSEDSKVEALDAGADDYITKPFRVGELMARLRAAVRRSNALEDDQPAIMIGNLMLDPERHVVTKSGHPVHLTRKEFELLHNLMMHAGRPILHARLLKAVWGADHGDDVAYLRTFIRQIRIMIEDDPTNPKYLLTDSGVGYRFSRSTENAE